MSPKTYVTDIERAPQSQIGATLDALFETIEARKDADDASGSYTRQLLDGKLEALLKKVSEETLETCLAAKECEMLAECRHTGFLPNGADLKAEDSVGNMLEDVPLQNSVSEEAESNDPGFLDAAIDHMRYEAADVVYHLLVLLSRLDVSIDEFAAELNYRMRDDERPDGCVLLHDEHVRRGK